MILIIDNYDSFTYNLVQYFGELGAEPHVVRNDALDVAGVAALRPERIVISPGPGTPDQAGVSLAVIRQLGEGTPILGVCLGHDGHGVFGGVSNPFTATRYHSLVILPESVPAELEVTAWAEDGEIMGVRHRTLPIEGVQFHPESILTLEGKRLLGNFLGAAVARP